MKKLLLVIGLQIFITPLAQAEFSDVPADHPYSEAINWAQENNIVNGFSDGTFKPDQKINRAELTKIIIEANFEDAEIYGDNCFSDVKDEWFAKYICTAKREGIVKGYEDGSFKPEQNVSFVESAKIIGLGLGEDLEDDEKIWYRNYVNYINEKRAILISIESFEYKIKKSEIIEIIWRLKNNITDKNSSIFNQYYYSDEIYKNVIKQYRQVNGKIFYDHKEIKDVDISSFEVLNLRYSYSKDKNYIYQGSSKIKNSDPDSFEISNIARDKNNVYRSEGPLYKADPKTYHFVGKCHAKDKNNVYFNYGCAIIDDDIDVDSFESISNNSCMAKDKNSIYNEYYKLKNSDSETFENLGMSYYKDKNNVYCSGCSAKTSLLILKDADPATFKILDHDNAKDKNNCYQRPTVSFEIVPMSECDKIEVENNK